MKIIIEFNLDSAAMREDEGIGPVDGLAVADILHKLATPFDDGATPMPGTSHRINDANGNSIGSITVTA